MATETVGEQQAFDLHKEYQHNAKCGFDRAITLNCWESAQLAATARSIQGIAAVLTAEGTEALDIGENIRSNLVTAIDTLSWHAQVMLDGANERAHRE